MRISDWSSDVCSSDLVAADAQRLQGDAERDRARELQLDRRLAPGHRSEERAQGDERLAVEARVGERRSRIDGLLVGLQGPVGKDLDARYAPSRLRDHALDPGAVGQRRARTSTRLNSSH